MMRILFLGIVILACLWLFFGVCTYQDNHGFEGNIPHENIEAVQVDSTWIPEDI